MAHTVRLESINAGPLSTIPGHRSRTGLVKTPRDGTVEVQALGLAGDAIGDLRHHGGHDQAVYLYSAADYAWWSHRLGRPCPPGLFGDNLTIDAWWETPRIGDRLDFGDVLLELTAPRIPCSTLAARMGDPTFVKAFTDAARPGAYARVLREGTLAAGTVATLQLAPTTHASVVDVFHLWPDQAPPADRLAAALAAPLASRARVKLAGRMPRIG